MKYLIYLFAVALITLASSCKKKEKELVASDYVNYVGKYYGIQKIDVPGFQSVNENESDVILATNVNDSKLFFKDQDFNLLSPSTLSYSYGNTYSSHANLTFSANFNQINFDQHSSVSDLTFNGNKTTLPITDDSEHPLKSQLEGLFILQINKQEYASSMDTSYIDTVAVTISGYKPVINGIEYYAEPFYTYYKRNFEYVGMVKNMDLYWVEDTLYLNYKDINMGGIDTIHHIYSGVRL